MINVLATLKQLAGGIASRCRCPTPEQCLLCGGVSTSGQPICLDCLSDLPWPRRPCGRCAEELPPGADGSWCERCLLRPPLFDRCIPLLRYEFPARELVAAFKFRAGFAAGRALGNLLAEALLANGDPLPQVLIPVPLHPQRLRVRGFNQSTLLAGAVSSRCGIPVLQGVERVRVTTIQRKLRASQRQDNLKDAFVVKSHRLDHLQHVAIVDDVVTTMNTANSLSSALLGAGITRIDVLCAARVS